jgi:WD40 repeat protein
VARLLRLIRSQVLLTLTLLCVLNLVLQPRLADAQTETPILRIEPGPHAAAVRRIAVDQQRGLVITASDDKTARVWDLRSGQLLQVLRPPTGGGDIGRMYGVALHPTNGKVALGGTTGDAQGGHRIYLFDPKSGRMESSFDARAGDIKKLIWSHDGSLVIAGYSGTNGVKAFDATGNLVFEDSFDGGVFGMAVSNNGLLVATGWDKTVRVYRASAGVISRVRSISTASTGSGARAEPLGVPVSPAISPDGKRVAIGFRSSEAEPIQVFDLETGRSILQFKVPKAEPGHQGSVAWSTDGRAVYAAGSAHKAGFQFPIFQYDANTGELIGEQTVARDSIFDLVALPDGSVAYSSLDGSWGVTAEAGKPVKVNATFSNLRNPGGLRISADTRRISWTLADSGQQKNYDIVTRVLASGAPSNLRVPITQSGWFQSAKFWENVLFPDVNGRKILLAQDERSRSLTYIPGTAQALLGSSRSVRRIDENGAVLWQVPTNAEVLAVNVGAEGKLFVTAMSDGTLRWFRLSDGQLLLTLYPSADGQWVIWTPTGYFDASAGADRLIGWTINRGPNSAADYFSLGRFRDKFQRPDVIDQVFSTLDVTAAVARANELVALARKSNLTEVAMAPTLAPPTSANTAPVATPAPGAVPAPAPASSQPKSLPAPAIKTQELPPSLAALESTLLRRTGSSKLSLPFSLRASGSDKAVSVEVRVNGRPVDVDMITLPAEFDGQSRGLAQLTVQDPEAVIQLIARNKFGVSEPLSFRLEAAIAAITANTVPPAARPATPQAPVVSPPVASVPATPAPIATAPTQPSTPTQPGAPLRPGTAPRPALYVLSIGISDFQRDEYKLGLAAKDARDFVKAMERQKGALYSAVSVKTLTNRDATRANIELGLAWLSSSVGPNDIGMLFMAGHGLNEPGGQYYFLPFDGNHTKLAATSVPEKSIRDTLGKIRGRALFFVDTCFAGNVVGSSVGGLANTSRELGRLASEMASAENGVVVFASSSGRQLSEEKDEWGNGAFTKALIDGLGGKADLTKTGRVTFKGLDFFVSEEVRRLTDGRQTPVTISPIGVADFSLASL